MSKNTGERYRAILQALAQSARKRGDKVEERRLCDLVWADARREARATA